jgi:hypothetical protein
MDFMRPRWPIFSQPCTSGYGDERRSTAWADVAERVRLRERDRLQQD